jgi:hypothetical protein
LKRLQILIPVSELVKRGIYLRKGAGIEEFAIRKEDKRRGGKAKFNIFNYIKKC